MATRLQLRRHLYEELTRTGRRGRRTLRRQLRLLDVVAPPGDTNGGAAGVREPRRPVPPRGPAARSLDVPGRRRAT